MVLSCWLGVLGWFMMPVYSIILCFMPKNDCCLFKVWPREGGALGSLSVFLKVSLPRHPGATQSAFAWFLLVQAKSFFPSLALGKLQQQSFSNLLRWTEQFVSSRPEKCGLQERGRLGSAGEGPLFQSQTSGKLSQGEKAHQEAPAQLLHLLWRGGQHQRVTRFSSVAQILHETPVWAFFFLPERDPNTILYRVSWAGIFPSIWGFVLLCGG